MNTRIEILSDEVETIVGGVVLAVSSTSFHTFSVDLPHDHVVAELQNMGGECVGGPTAAIVYIENWEGDLTVVVEDSDIAEKVWHRLSTV